jgi:hypothetical protein
VSYKSALGLQHPRQTLKNALKNVMLSLSAGMFKKAHTKYDNKDVE